MVRRLERSHPGPALKKWIDQIGHQSRMHDNFVALKVHKHIAGDCLRNGGDAISAGAKRAIDNKAGPRTASQL